MLLVLEDGSWVKCVCVCGVGGGTDFYLGMYCRKGQWEEWWLAKDFL
jgi:hypothetical protein